MQLFVKLFGPYLQWFYHCFDRIVINGYLSFFTREINVVWFFRQLCQKPKVTKEVLRERTDAYQAWVAAYARNHRLPMEWAVPGRRKEDWVRPALQRMMRQGRCGVYYILQSMEQGWTFRVVPPRYPTTDQVETARTRQLIAADSVEEAQKNLVAAIVAVDQAKAERTRAEDEIGQEDNVNGHIAAAEAQLSEAELNLEYCHVRAPFTGRIVNFNISLGEFARTGVDVFTLVDTRTWYVVANFRETQLKHIQEGEPAEIYLQFKGGRRFEGSVVGLAWAVVPEDGTSANGLPSVPRNLDWVRLAQRFPVRVQVQNPDDSFRLGASAVVTITGPAQAKNP